ncbi:MAG: tripartite tricarboxylate transporter permease [Thermodesulfobacteriota bacterium]
MDAFAGLMTGFAAAMSPENLYYAFIGCMFGTLIGILPGVGSAAGMAILIPITFKLPAAGAIIMLSALFYGSYYGGTITTVLLGVPGETASAVTLLDGYQMAKQGRGGAALSAAAIGSFIGGTFAVFGLVIAAPVTVKYALKFGPTEFFSLMIVATALLMGLAGKSMLKALIMGLFGFLIATVGMDPAVGAPRFTFGRVELMDGVSFVPVVMGLFGLSEILTNLENPAQQVFETKMSSLIPTRQDIKDCVGPVTRGTILGFLLGLIPGTTQALAAFVSYTMEVKASKHPEKFGNGAIEGVAGPETANNAHANAALIPLFTLGVPGSPSIAILLGAFMMNGLAPGPLLFTEHPDLTWTVIASFYIGNFMLLILNLPAIPMWVTILKIPYAILTGLILAFMLIGSYSLSNSMFDIGTLILFGILGYIFRKADFPLAPAAMTLILGPLLEKKLRLALELSDGDFSVFFTRPISGTLLALAAIIILWPAIRLLISRIRRTAA